MDSINLVDGKQVQGIICNYSLPQGPSMKFFTIGSDSYFRPTPGISGAIIPKGYSIKKLIYFYIK
jgi:hypothetical protein